MTSKLLLGNRKNGSLEVDVYQSFQEAAEEVTEPVIKYLRTSDPKGKYHVEIDGQRSHNFGLKTRVIKIL